MSGLSLSNWLKNILIIVLFVAFFKVISSDSSSSINDQDDAVIVEYDDFVEVLHYVSSFISIGCFSSSRKNNHPHELKSKLYTNV